MKNSWGGGIGGGMGCVGGYLVLVLRGAWLQEEGGVGGGGVTCMSRKVWRWSKCEHRRRVRVRR